MVLFLYIIIIIKIINFRDFQHKESNRETNKKKKKSMKFTVTVNAKELSRFPEHKLKADTKKLK